MAVIENRFDAQLHISRFDENSFTAAGRRDFLKYRDLGITESTNGSVGGVITRVTGDPSGVKTGWHYHICDLQLFYILNGWIEIEFEDTGVLRLEAGTCVSIPPGVIHNETALSPDMEVLEITIPPKIGTVGVPEPSALGADGADSLAVPTASS